jgi:hypothetical protein
MRPSYGTHIWLSWVLLTFVFGYLEFACGVCFTKEKKCFTTQYYPVFLWVFHITILPNAFENLQTTPTVSLIDLGVNGVKVN